MKRELLEILACPRCASDLLLEEAGNETNTGFLGCNECGARFPIVRSIPRFVQSDKYASSFSFEWNRHPKLRFGRESEEDFILRTGFTPKDLDGRLVLDVGCGSGRFMDVVQKWGGRVVGFDLSYSIDEAYKTLGSHDGMHFLQADIESLPFKDEVFDFIYSIGVLHHTYDTRRSFLKLPRLLKRGGRVSIWVYPKWYEVGPLTRVHESTTVFYRRITTKMPAQLLHYLCYTAIPLYYLRKLPHVHRLVHNIVPISDSPDWRHRVLDTFDWYSPKYQHRLDRREVVSWFKDAGLVDIKVLNQPVSVTGESPA